MDEKKHIFFQFFGEYLSVTYNNKIIIITAQPIRHKEPKLLAYT